jgi:CDP-diacylglycerol--serine O-phosphatidyltransferase
MKHTRITRQELKAKIISRRYLIPNAVTLGNMFCGFLSCIYSASDRFEKAALAIGIAIVLDGLDGRIARRLNATSKFGVEFDSFADLVSFGVAPAMLIYQWCFRQPADEFGVLITFMYAVCAASRLARFNLAQENLKNFVGLPSPGAAGMVAALVNFMPRTEPHPAVVVAATLLMVALGYLMVSRIEYLSIKRLKVSRYGLFFVAILIPLTWYKSHVALLLLALCYAASGPLSAVLIRRQGQKPKGNADGTSEQPGRKSGSSSKGLEFSALSNQEPQQPLQ